MLGLFADDKLYHILRLFTDSKVYHILMNDLMCNSVWLNIGQVDHITMTTTSLCHYHRHNSDDMESHVLSLYWTVKVGHKMVISHPLCPRETNISYRFGGGLIAARLRIFAWKTKTKSKTKSSHQVGDCNFANTFNINKDIGSIRLQVQVLI